MAHFVPAGGRLKRGHQLRNLDAGDRGTRFGFEGILLGEEGVVTQADDTGQRAR